MGATSEYQPMRAPRRHGEAVIDPPAEALAALVAANRHGIQQWAGGIQGRSWSALRAEARRGLLAEARQYTTAYRDVAPLPDDGDAPLLLAGHQPQLFHAGVWFKNFMLSSLGQQLGAAAVNLLVDNDIVHTSALRVPVAGPDGLRVEQLAFDRAAEGLPYEERDIADEAAFISFGTRAVAASAGCLPPPLVGTLWPLACEAARRSRNLGRCLAEARHRLEGQWRQQTLEVPLSAVCASRPFAWFTAHLLAHLPRFHEIHNSALAEYRRRHRVRSRAHPVPDLARQAEWREAPFWLWTTTAPRRRRLFVRCRDGGWELTDREHVQLLLPGTPDGDAERAVEQLANWAARGVKLRPRALITTMYARLLLADAFLHGIGGAHYDRLTDRLIERFFGLSPPRFATLSATVLLFPDRTPELRRQWQAQKQLGRELQYAPERHVPRNPDVQPLLEAKAEWVRQTPPRGQRRARHVAIQQINERLQAWLTAERDGCAQRLAALQGELRHHQALASREFSFCLFPEAVLRPLLLQLSHQQTE